MTHAEPNEELGFSLTELTTATNNGDHMRAITFLEAIEMSGETSNIGENANELISAEESGRTERAVRKSEQRLKIYVNKKHKHSLKNEEYERTPSLRTNPHHGMMPIGQGLALSTLQLNSIERELHSSLPAEYEGVIIGENLKITRNI